MFSIGPFEYSFKKNLYQIGSEIAVKKIFCRETLLIHEKELVVITGRSGAGKSTLLSLLKGIIPQYSSGEFTGSILYKGKPLFGESFQANLKEILFLFQNPFSQLIYPKAAEEFFFSMENFNFSREQMDQQKMELGQLFELDELWDKKTNDLSNGECQRLVLASLMAIGPEVLLLDEPTAFLDPEARRDFYQWLKKMKGLKTIILVDHHLNEILPLVDKVIHVEKSGEVTLGTKELSLPKVQSPSLAFQSSERAEVELSLSHLFFHYPTQTHLLEDVSLTARSGEVVVLKGKNGKGKSTLFKIMAGLLKPQKGLVTLKKEGVNISPKKFHQEMGFIFQNPESHFFYDTIKEELQRAGEKSELKNLQERFFGGIDLNRSPFLLSEGEKRRLTLLMTVFLDKSILLYDEPTFGQDQESISAIIEMIHALKALGKIQLIISHDDHFISAVADRSFELKNGQLL